MTDAGLSDSKIEKFIDAIASEAEELGNMNAMGLKVTGPRVEGNLYNLTPDYIKSTGARLTTDASMVDVRGILYSVVGVYVDNGRTGIFYETTVMGVSKARLEELAVRLFGEDRLLFDENEEIFVLDTEKAPLVTIDSIQYFQIPL